MPTPIQKGHKKMGGRVKGTPNAINKSVKECVLSTFQALQQDPKHNLKSFAEKYPREFYQIAAKLIPTDIKADLTSDGKELRHWTVEIVKPKK
jgi:hypothetical protein